MSWKEYLAKRRYRLTLEKLDMPDFWIELRELKTLTIAEFKKLTSIKPGTDPESLDASKVIDVIGPLVTAWNLTDPETGEPLPIPSKAGDKIDRIPIDILLFINTEMSEREKAATVPQTPRT
jgi:hypothetical protein